MVSSSYLKVTLHVIYRWKASDEKNTMKWINGLGEIKGESILIKLLKKRKVLTVSTVLIDSGVKFLRKNEFNEFSVI
jgi:hypothetical protein